MDQKNRLLREAYLLLSNLTGLTYVTGSMHEIEMLRRRIAKNLQIVQGED